MSLRAIGNARSSPLYCFFKISTVAGSSISLMTKRRYEDQFFKTKLCMFWEKALRMLVLGCRFMYVFGVAAAAHAALTESID